jgi:hypothetical protein
VLNAGKQFLTHVIPAVLKPIRILWNELIAFIFLAFGVLVGFSTWNSFKDGGQAQGNLLTLIMGTGFTLMLLGYGLSSLWRARKISRS